MSPLIRTNIYLAVSPEDALVSAWLITISDIVATPRDTIKREKKPIDKPKSLSRIGEPIIHCLDIRLGTQHLCFDSSPNKSILSFMWLVHLPWVLIQIYMHSPGIIGLFPNFYNKCGIARYFEGFPSMPHCSGYGLTVFHMQFLQLDIWCHPCCCSVGLVSDGPR